MAEERTLRAMPADVVAERAVLGACLRKTAAIDDCSLILAGYEDFFAYKHQLIWRCMAEERTQGNPIDPVTLYQALVAHGWLDDVGAQYIPEIWEGAPSTGNAEYYAKIVRDKAVLRKLIYTADEISKSAWDQTDKPEALLERAELDIMKISILGNAGTTFDLPSTVNVAFDEVVQRVEFHRGGGKTRAILTNWPDLDHILAGFHKSELTVVGARPGCGKTSFALNFAWRVAQEVPFYFVSLEMNRQELGTRLLSMEGAVDNQKMRRGTVSDKELSTLLDAKQALFKRQVHIDDHPYQSMTRIAANARRLKAKHNIGIVIIDYIQLVEAESKRDSRQEQVSQMSRRAKLLAKELEIPVVVLAQLNRETEKRGDNKPKLSDLRESGAIEQDADVVLLLHRTETGDQADRIEVIIGKQRNGPTGSCSLIHLKNILRMENAASESQRESWA